jgi:hypothetical protein
MRTKRCSCCHKNLTMPSFPESRNICSRCVRRNQQKKEDTSEPSLVHTLLSNWRPVEVEDA